MRTKVPKEKRNETLTLSDRKHFAAMIRSGAKYQEVLREHLRIYKKTIRHVFIFFEAREILVFQFENF